jgi:predicted outer membrane protein
MLKLSNPVRSLALAAILSLGASACITGRTSVSPAMMPHHQALHAISMASHMAEIEEGQLALTRATTQPAREFAQRMVTEHTAAMRMGEQMMAGMGMGIMKMGGGASASSGASGGGMGGSAGAGMTMDMGRMRAALLANPHSRPMVEDHMRAMQMLGGAAGAAFDQAYMNRQVMAHQMTLANMDRVMGSMGMQAEGGSIGAGATAGMDHGNMGGMNHGHTMPATREGMMMMHRQERAMVAMHLQMARQMSGR